MLRKRILLIIALVFFASPFSVFAFTPVISNGGLCLKVTADGAVLNNPSPWAGFIPLNQQWAFPIFGGGGLCSGIHDTFGNRTPIDGQYQWINTSNLSQINLVYVIGGLFSLTPPLPPVPPSLASSSISLILSGVTDLGTGLLAILVTVIALIVGVFIFRKGIRWMKLSAQTKLVLGDSWEGKDSMTGRTYKQYSDTYMKTPQDFLNHRHDS